MAIETCPHTPSARTCGGTIRLEMLRPLAAICISAPLAFGAALTTPVAAAQSVGAPPLPPPRPALLGQPQATTPPSQPSGQSAADEPLDLDHPPMLPAASKARMSECGHEWAAMKKAGKDFDIRWRDFAKQCLTR